MSSKSAKAVQREGFCVSLSQKKNGVVYFTILLFFIKLYCHQDQETKHKIKENKN